MDLPAGRGALSAAEDDLEHESAAAGVVVRRPRAGGSGRGRAAAGWRAAGDAVRPGRFGEDAAGDRVGGRSGPEFRNGVFWIGLAALGDPTLVAETVAQTLGAKDGLAEYIGERELLLLLDNFEQVVEAASGASCAARVLPEPSPFGHEPGAVACPGRGRVCGGAARGIRGGRALLHPLPAQGERRRSRSSAVGSTTCLSRSSSLPPARASLLPARSWSGSRSASIF